MPRWPNLPDRPMRCKYVSAILGKSKFMTTLTACMSIPLVKRSERLDYKLVPNESVNPRYIKKLLMIFENKIFIVLLFMATKS